MTKLQIRQAVYGPQSNGSAVQLLAQSEGLSQEALSEFSRFYYAAWEVSSEERDEFLTFLPLDKSTWGLIRSKVVDERSMGVLFVSKLFALDIDDLAKIDWASNRVWGELLRDELVAPRPKTELPLCFVDIADGPLAETSTEAAESLAFATDTTLAKAGVVISTAENVPSPIDGLAMVLERLGGLAQGRTYCTSSKFANSGFTTSTGSIDILASDDNRSGGNRVSVNAQASLDQVWIERRLIEHGVKPVSEPMLDGATINALAADILAERREELLEESDFSSIFSLAAKPHKGRSGYVAPVLLSAVLESLPDPRRGAELLDEFVSTALDDCPTDGRLRAPRDRVAAAAAKSGTLFWASRKTVEAFGAAILFGEGRSLDTGLLNTLEESLAKILGTDGPDMRPDAINGLLDLTPADEDFDALRSKLLAICAATPKSKREPIKAHFEKFASFSEFEAEVQALSSLIPRGMQRSMEQNIADIRQEKVLAAITAPDSFDDGLSAVLSALKDPSVAKLLRGGGVKTG